MFEVGDIVVFDEANGGDGASWVRRFPAYGGGRLFQVKEFRQGLMYIDPLSVREDDNVDWLKPENPPGGFLPGTFRLHR
jgi:hypothetical protein